MSQSQSPQSSKPKWAVGSFLQQAVAGVESRLDHILADPEDLAEKNKTPPPPPPVKVKTEDGGDCTRIPNSTFILSTLTG